MTTMQEARATEAQAAACARSAWLLSAFDALEAGQTLLLVSRQEPWGLLETLQEARKGLFDWSPVALDPPGWEVEISRRDGAADAGRTLTDALQREHAHLAQLEERAFHALSRGERERARRLYAGYAHGVDRHMRAEEHLLFPVFEVKSGLPYGGPTSVMRGEHQGIRSSLAAMLELRANGAEAMREARDALLSALRDHERKEESILYPGIDRLLTAEERDALVSRFQRYPR